MRSVITILTMILISNLCFATSQIPDGLIWKGDTLSIFSNPLESHSEIENLRPKLFGDKEGCGSTACWRGYQAEWEIIEDELYLVGIYSCCFYEDSLKADLQELFPRKFIKGKVKADWVSHDILIVKGDILHYEHMGYNSIYEKEIKLTFKNGKLIKIKEYDNTKSSKSIYTQNPDSLKNFLLSNVNWKKLPDLKNNTRKVLLSFQPNKLGKPKNVKVRRGAEKVFNREAIRVIKQIPEWDIYYRHGKFYPMNWTFMFIFKEEDRIKYAR